MTERGLAMKRSSTWIAILLVMTLLFVSACSTTDESNKKVIEVSSNSGGNEKQAETAPESPIVDGKFREPLTMSIAKFVDPADKSLPTGDTIDNNLFTRYITEKTNISFEAIITGSGDSYRQK